MGLGRSIGLLLTSPHQGVCSASITTAVSTAGRIIAVCSARGGSQVSQHSACCQRKTHWSLKVMKRLSQRPCFLLRSVPALTLNRSKSADDPCVPASHSRIHVICLPRVSVCVFDKEKSSLFCNDFQSPKRCVKSIWVVCLRPLQDCNYSFNANSQVQKQLNCLQLVQHWASPFYCGGAAREMHF